MTASDKNRGERPDPASFEGFIARAMEQNGLKAAIKEAETAFEEFSNVEASRAAEGMNPRVRTVVLKMIKARG